MSASAKNFIAILGQHGGSEYNPIKHWLAKQFLTVKSQQFSDELLAALKSDNQEILLDVAEIVGKSGNKEAIPHLKDILNRKDLWGSTALNSAVALIRLGDDFGLDYLKMAIKDSKTHRDLRINAANALIKMGKKNVFIQDEPMDYSGESMTPEWSEVLQKLVEKLS